MVSEGSTPHESFFPKQNQSFRLRTSVDVAKRLPKALQKTNQNYPKPLRNSVKALWRRSLGARTKKSSFLKDVLNEITVLRGSEDLAWGPKPRKKVFGGIPETSSRGLKMISEAGTPQKSFFIKQNRIFWLGTPVNIAKRLPKALQKTNQNYPKLHRNNVKALSGSILGARTKKTAFLIDVLNKITVFGTKTKEKCSQRHAGDILETTKKSI